MIKCYHLTLQSVTSEFKNKNLWIHIKFFSKLGCGLGDRQFLENSVFRGMTVPCSVYFG